MKIVTIPPSQWKFTWEIKKPTQVSTADLGLNNSDHVRKLQEVIEPLSTLVSNFVQKLRVFVFHFLRTCFKVMLKHNN